MPPARFAVGIFQEGACVYVWAGLDYDPPVYTSTGMVVKCLPGMHEVLSSNPSTQKNVAIYISHVAGMTDMPHHIQLFIGGEEV
jgi:hypothetical protein